VQDVMRSETSLKVIRWKDAKLRSNTKLNLDGPGDRPCQSLSSSS
jgi:hypothetical protein